MALLETFIAEPPPLHHDEDGTVRVGGTRVTLDTVVSAWERGVSADGIVGAYDALTLADVHAVISYYLRHRGEVEAYLAERRHDAQEIRREVELHTPPFPTCVSVFWPADHRGVVSVGSLAR